MMLKTLGLVAALVGLSAVPALAHSACQEPIAPAAVDGSTATTAQMNGAHDDVITFIKQSDDYQSCVLQGTQRRQGRCAEEQESRSIRRSRPPLPQKVDGNQHLKEKVGGEYNAAVMAYKAKHPNG